jgi:hypothetical protein
MFEIDLGFLERAFLDLYLRFGLVESRLCLIQLGLRRVLLLYQFLHPLFGDAGELERSPGVVEIPLRLNHIRLENRRIDLRHNLPRFDRRIKIYEQFQDIARNLASDLHVDDRVESSRRCNRLGDIAARHGRGLIGSTAVPGTAPKTEDKEKNENDCGDDDEGAFHEKCRRHRVGSYPLD